MNNEQLLQVVQDHLAANGGSAEWTTVMEAVPAAYRQHAAKMIGREHAAKRLVRTVRVDRETGQSTVTVALPGGGVTND